MTRIKKLNINLEEALSNLTEFREKGDQIDSTVSEYLISHGFVKPNRMQVNFIDYTMGGRREPFEIINHSYFWTPLGNEVYAKLSRYDSLPGVVKPLYRLFI